MDRREKIIEKLKMSKKDNLNKINTLHNKGTLTNYKSYVRTKVENGSSINIWTDALQTALIENEIVIIPAGDDVYYIDNTVVIPSNRRIEADSNAHIRLTAETDVLMLRNAHTCDGTHEHISGIDKDCNISIEGGIWEETNTKRRGYGLSGKYDKDRRFFGVSTCMLFNNMENLTLQNMVFAHTAGFAVQAGDIKNVVCEHIRFVECYADGLHINGNTENLSVNDISGQVGDDLVALNMYDWQNSSIDFGPLQTALIENLALSDDSQCKAFRIQPGIYTYNNGTKVDCSINDVIIRHIKGITTFKMYFQTPQYYLGTEPERGETGSGDYIYFEDIDIDLDAPIDMFPEYVNSHPVRGNFAAFEIGANIGHLYLSNIDITLYKDKYPMSYLLCIGPKSCIKDGREVFDPYIDSSAEHIIAENIKVNGKKINDLSPFVKEIEFNDVNNDNNSTGKGCIKEIVLIK